jgi:hypothetical protein
VSGRAAIALSTSAIVVASLLTMGAVTRSNASWTDNEHAVGSVGAVNCAASNGAFMTRGDGRMVSGGLLGVDLDTVAAASGMLATNDGTRPLPNPPGANHATDVTGGADPNAYVNSLNATALGAVDVNLGAGGIVDLASILQLPLDNSLGVLNQYGRAASDGTAAAGSGLVTDSGSVATADAGGGYPDLGSVNLKTLVGAVNPAVAAGLSTIADAKLTVGAVSGRESMDGCDAAFNGVTSALTREYLVAGLGVNVNSSTVGALVTGLGGVVDGVGTAASGIASNPTVKSGIVTALNGVLNTALGGSALLQLGSANVQLSQVSIDLSPVRSLLTTPFGDSGGLVSIDPSSGTVTIDLAALLAQTYPAQYSNGLNGLAPNTHLLVNANVVDALAAALGSALDDWISDVQAALSTAVNLMTVTADVTVNLTAHICVAVCLNTPLGNVTAHVGGSLQSLLNGTAPVTTKLNLLSLIDLSNFPGVGALVTAVTNALVGNLAGIVGNGVNGVMGPLSTIGTSVSSLTEPIVTAISGLFSALFVNQVVTLDVNAQNDPLAGNPEPVDWSGLPAGQYDVAALRVGILDAAGASNVHLYLGRASVGVTCSISGSGCVGY